MQAGLLRCCSCGRNGDNRGKIGEKVFSNLLDIRGESQVDKIIDGCCLQGA